MDLQIAIHLVTREVVIISYFMHMRAMHLFTELPYGAPHKYDSVMCVFVFVCVLLVLVLVLFVLFCKS